MEIRNDYILRVIQQMIEALCKLVKKENIDSQIVEEALDQVVGSDLVDKLPASILVQMIEISCRDDEDKKALASAALFLKDPKKYQKICERLLEKIDWQRLNPRSAALLQELFNKSQVT